MNCPTGFHISSFVLHSGNHHHWDKCTLLKGAVGGHDFSVPFFTAACLHLQENSEVYTTHEVLLETAIKLTLIMNIRKHFYENLPHAVSALATLTLPPMLWCSLSKGKSMKYIESCSQR